MKLTTHWTQEKFHLLSTDGRHEVRMDTRPPLGDDSDMTPKQLVVAGLAGCTLMDVVALMRKHHQPVELLEVDAEVEKSTGGYPEVFTAVLLTFRLKGNLDPARVLDAVEASQTKYCGVSAMLSKAFPIRYRVELNAERIGEGEARF